MAGQRVTWQMRPSEIGMWTEPKVRQMVQDVFSVDDEKAKEAKRVINNIVCSMQSRLVSLAQGYLGEDTCMDGGTIGEPVTQKEYVHILLCRRRHLCIELMMWYFLPPLTWK